jgi:hypothetical protein
MEIQVEAKKRVKRITEAKAHPKAKSQGLVLKQNEKRGCDQEKGKQNI